MTLEQQSQELLKRAQVRIIELVEQNNALIEEKASLLKEASSAFEELTLVRQAFELVENFAEEPFETYESMLKSAAAYNETMDKHAAPMPRIVTDKRKSTPSLGKVASPSEVKDTNVEFKRNPSPADVRYQERMSDLFQQF